MIIDFTGRLIVSVKVLIQDENGKKELSPTAAMVVGHLCPPGKQAGIVSASLERKHNIIGGGITDSSCFLVTPAGRNIVLISKQKHFAAAQSF